MEYLNEEQYQKNNKKVKNVGKILLIVGIVLLIIGIILGILGFASFGNLFGNVANTNEEFENTASSIFGTFGLFAISMIIDFIGSTLIMAGGITMFIGHRREITAYSTQQVMPIVQEGAEKMAPTAGKVAKEITKGIKEGLKEE